MRQRLNHILTLLRGSKVEDTTILSVNDTSHNIICEIFTEGNCGNLAIILAEVFGGKLCANDVHAFVEIQIDSEPTYWDITGEIFPKWFNYYSKEELIDNMFVDNYSFELRGSLA